ncbi:E3 ubiquitin-protein ligase TRIM56-like [Patiria miniata]|uniref:Tripartite motif-containing protein 2-like n=1 Tax=Patiria miniata TaxID=46514 RepID=A0A914ANP9_PATMI|nr:E3 ubiquitin-protein ligase TRIM56-like [Patiria miniata]
MATATSVGSAFKKIGTHLECSICTEIYKQPKILTCLHNFCKECLVKYRDGTYRGSPQIPCPVCRQEMVLPQSGIQGLKTNFHLVALIEEFELQEKVACSGLNSKLLCETCDEDNEALYHCLDCGMNICTSCRKAHLRFTVSANHAVATLNDIRQGKVNLTKQPAQSKCHKHKEGITQFYCKTCDELICQVCTVLDHSKPDHDIIDIGKASKEFRQSLEKGFPAVEKEIKGLEVSLQGVAASKKVLNDNTTEARKKVQDRAAEGKAKINAEEKRLLDEITTQEHEQNKRLVEHEKTLSNSLQRKKHCLQTSQEVTRNASDSHFLSLHPVISKDMDKLRGQPTPKMAGLKLHPVFVKSKKLDIDLGKVMVEDTWEIGHSFGKKGSGKGEFESARGIAAAADPDEIAVADWKNDRVVICNNQGQTKNTIPIDPNDVVAVSNQWVCAHPSKMMVYHRDTTHKFDFRTVPEDEVGKTVVQLVSVAVMPNGNIIAGDKVRKVLTEHNPRNGDILHTMPVKITPDFLAVLSNGWIVISDKEQGLVETVKVSNGNAVTVSTIQPTIDGKPAKYCGGVCSNSSGIYLAVVTGKVHTGHIHHYNCACQFVSCVAQGLYDPCGITFTAADGGQQLAVADWHSVKIYHKV